MSHLRNIFLYLLLAAISSCGGEALDKQLAQAKTVIEDKPDSAYALLNEILFPEELPVAQRAEFARLYAKAAAKSGNSFLTDTMLVAAAEYYLAQGDSLAAHECYLLEGERQSKMENVDMAVDFMEAALSLLPDSLSANRDLINHNTFQTIVSPNSFDDAKPYARRLIASKDSAFVALGYYDLGCAYNWQNSEDKAVADSAFLFMEKAVAIAERNNAPFLPHFLRNSVNFRLHKAEVLRRLHKVIALEGESSNICAELARCHLVYREADSAAHYLDRADSLYSRHWSGNGHEYVSMKNQLATLRTALNLMQGKQDFLVFPGPFNDSIYFAGQRYQANQAEVLNNLSKTSKRELLHAERHHNQALVILCLIFTLTIGTAGAFLYIRINHRKWAETQEKVETLERMIKETGTRADGTGKSELKKVLLQQLGVIKLIASTPTETNKNLLRNISRLQWEGKDFDGVLNWPDIYSLIDSVFDSFHTKLTARFGSLLNEKEIQLICLLKADFSTKEISVLVEQSTRTIYQRKSDIRRKLRLDEAADIISELTAKL